MKYNLFYFILVFLLIFPGCKPDLIQESEGFTLKVALDNEPNFLHPMISRMAEATQLENLIFSSPQIINPENNEVEPILLKEKITRSEFENGVQQFDMEFRSEATWDDGSPVTAEDYLFTVKASQIPFLSNNSWLNSLSIIDSIQIDQSNTKKCSVFLSEKTINDDLLISVLPIYSKHYYDSANVLENLGLTEIRSVEIDDSSNIFFKTLREFAANFSNAEISRQKASGCGPYKLTEWIANERIVFFRKESWWGNVFAEVSVFFQSNPAIIEYYIIPEEQTTAINLKNGQLDLFYGFEPQLYNELQKDSNNPNFQLESTLASLSYYLPINNQSPYLNTREMRKALAYCLDLDKIIDRLFYGLAEKMNSPLHPSSPYYNHDIPENTFDLDRAKKILTQQGWEDINGDGIREKNIAGSIRPLQMTLLVSPRGLSYNIGQIFREDAAKAGIEINVIDQEFRISLQQIRQKNYDIAALGSTHPPGLYNPYNSWHSDNIAVNGSNYCAFSNERADEIIEQIQKEDSPDELAKLYREFQQTIYDEQPAIWLVVPKIPIAYNRKLSVETFSRLPGFYEPSIKLKQ